MRDLIIPILLLVGCWCSVEQPVSWEKAPSDHCSGFLGKNFSWIEDLKYIDICVQYMILAGARCGSRRWRHLLGTVLPVQTPLLGDFTISHISPFLVSYSSYWIASQILRKWSAVRNMKGCSYILTFLFGPTSLSPTPNTELHPAQHRMLTPHGWNMLKPLQSRPLQTTKDHCRPLQITADEIVKCSAASLGPVKELFAMTAVV